MPLIIVRNDITKMAVDAIVNAANESLLGGGGVDGAIHRAAGRGLLNECRALGGCKTGKAKITGGYKLPAKYVIHTVGPVYSGGNNGERELLASCYRESLALAKSHGCESVAFPLISSGAYGYPKDQALKIATDVISGFVLENDITVYLVVFDKGSYNIGEKLFSDIEEYIDDKYVNEHLGMYFSRRIDARRRLPESSGNKVEFLAFSASSSIFDEDEPCRKRNDTDRNRQDISSIDSLSAKLENIDESFSEMLLRKIDEKGMKDSECYKKANVDRKLFSKIRSDVHYRPSKITAIAFAIALELSLAETEDMLRKAGFALSRSNKFDIIIEYFITHGNYNIFEINKALFAFDQCLLGV